MIFFMKKIFTLVLLACILTLRPVASVYAINDPDFPLCANPSGQVLVHYDTGTHGIAGSSGTYSGSDTVYNVNDLQVMQCFCSTDGSGIQTNWWNASSLSEEQVNVLKSQGWIYVPTGNLWGLSESPYLAKNLTYSCLPTGGGDPNGGGDGRSDGKSDGRSSCPECTQAPIGGGDILGASTGDILGLAATGDSWMLYSVFGVALFMLISGVIKVRKNS